MSPVHEMQENQMTQENYTILHDGHVLVSTKPLIGHSYSVWHYLCLTDDGYLTLFKYPLLKLKGFAYVPHIFYKFRISKAEPKKIFNCVKFKSLQPDNVWILHVPMQIGSKRKCLSVVVGDRALLENWIRSMMSLVVHMKPPFQHIVNNPEYRTFVTQDREYFNKDETKGRANEACNGQVNNNGQSQEISSSSDSGITE